jgi:hypothetical protein
MPIKGSKTSKREHLRQVAKQTGRTPKELNLPEFPVELGYFVEWSSDLIRSEPLTFTEIKNWSDLTRTFPAPWEVSVLMAVDTIFHKVKNSRE